MFPALWGWMFAQPLYRLTLKGRVPDGLRGVPPEPWPGDPALGRAILDSGTVPEGGHGFAWLVDMKAAARPNAADRARGLIAEWIADNRRWRADSWRPDVIGERLVNWFRCYDFLMTGADGDFRARFLASVVEQARHLGRVVGRGPGGRRRMLAIKGLILSGLAVPGCEERMERAFRILQSEIALQVMADGGHASRSPLGQLEVLRDLVEMRGALIGARWQVPDSLQGAIDRMTPMLRALRLGDGRLALFNGSWEDTDERIEQALAEAGGRAVVPKDGAEAALTAAGFARGDAAEYDRLRLTLGLPDGSRDLVADKSILLESGFDELNGVDWQKGCYMGQELTARTKYRGLVKKRLMPVTFAGPPPAPGTPVMLDGREAGETRSVAKTPEGGLGLALMRLDALEGGAEGKAFTAADVPLKVVKPAWAAF